MTNEFNHYPGCKHRDPDNCGACALTDLRQDRPNYSGWPLVYMENGRPVPAKWRRAFAAELARTDTPGYARKLRETLAKYGVSFTREG